MVSQKMHRAHAQAQLQFCKMAAPTFGGSIISFNDFSEQIFVKNENDT